MLPSLNLRVTSGTQHVETAAFPCSRTVPSRTVPHKGCYLPFLSCIPGQVGDLVDLTRSTEKRIQISCLSLSGSICYGSAALLFILLRAWLEVQVDAFPFQGVNMLQALYISSCCYRQIHMLATKNARNYMRWSDQSCLVC